MKKLKMLLTIAIFYLVVVGSLPVKVAAEGAPISVKAILPENQLELGRTFYDVRTQPGQEQDLELRVYNTSDKEQVVGIKVNTGRTSDGGSIDYSVETTADNKDSSMRLSISDMATLAEPKVTVPAKKDIIVKIHLKMPSESFDGMLLGGVYVTQETATEKEQAEKKGGMSIENKMAYVIGLRVTQNDTPVEGKLAYQRAYAAQSVGRNQVNVNLQNPTATALNDMTYDAQIYKKGKTDILHEAKNKNFRVAPNTNYNYVVSWENKPFQAGEYRLKLTAKSEETGQKWDWDETFTISSDEARELNKKALDLDQDYTMYYLMGAGAVSVLLLLLMIILISRKKKREAAKRKRGRKKKSPRKKGDNHGKRRK